MATTFELRTWLEAELARSIGVPAPQIHSRARFKALGLDSRRALEMVAALSRYLGRPVSPTVFWEHPTLDQLVAHLEQAPVPVALNPVDRSEAGPAPVTVRRHEPIAVVGLACRFPKAPSVAAYWSMLTRGVDAISEVPPSRWDLRDWYDADPGAPGKMNTRFGGFLDDDVALFDAGYFGISAREARQMDPQQRLMLKLACEGLEDAGVPIDSLVGSRTGVYVGVIWNDYLTLQHHAGGAAIDAYSATGSHYSIIANRISYALGLMGPSMAIDTACSSSLVSMHLACAALRERETDMALAGGVNLIVAPESTVNMSKFGAMAPDGRSKAFDASANGYVRGEGGGVVVLKRLSDAVRNRDSIYCVIRGSAINNDGPSNGLPAPNPQAQEDMLREAYRRAEVDVSQLQYIETHGTGTNLGDPIEANAIGRAVALRRPRTSPLFIGSVKSNFGHLEAAAGVAGFIKAALVLKNRSIPPSLHFKSPNPMIPFDALNMRVPTHVTPLPAEPRPAVAGVSSFGFGGTNCHLVLQEWPTSSTGVTLWTRDKATVQLLVGETPSRPAADLPDGAIRAAAVHHDVVEREQIQEDFAGQRATPRLVTSTVSDRAQLAWVFSGQGGHWVGMARALYAADRAFADALRDADRAVRAHAELSVLDQILDGAGAAPSMQRPDVMQPVLFAVQYAQSRWLRGQGVRPDLVIGHSFGEIAAACAANALSLEDGALIAVWRGRLIHSDVGPGGGMAVLPLDIAATRALLQDHPDLDVGAENSPRSTVISGPATTVERIVAGLAERGITAHRVAVEYAGHSRALEPVLARFSAAISAIRPRSGSVPILSTVTLQRLDGYELGPAYWARNLRSTVRFQGAIEMALASGVRAFLEIGPHPVLVRAIEDVAATQTAPIVARGLTERGEPEVDTAAAALAQLHLAGIDVPGPTDVAQLLPLSARSPGALSRLAKLTADALALPGATLATVCATAGARRSHYDHRAAIVATSIADCRAQLEALSQSGEHAFLGNRPSGDAPGLAFVFSGQGGAWWGMGRGLYQTEPAFRAAFDAVDAALRPLTEWSLVDELRTAEREARVARTEIGQPLTFAIQVGLAAVWQSWGLVPQAIVGHSMGEVAAAYCAGALSLEDACLVIHHRSRLMRKVAGQGATAMVRLSPADAEARCVTTHGRVTVAGINGPRSVILSGGLAEVDALLAELATARIEARRLAVDVAFHGPQMDALKPDLVRALSALRPQEERVPLYSSVTASKVRGPDLDASYWAQNLREPFRFAETVTRMLADGARVFVEQGPHPVLQQGLLETAADAGTPVVALGALHRKTDDRVAMLNALARLYVDGAAPQFEAVALNGDVHANLPHYPWQEERFWLPRRSQPTRNASSLTAAGSRVQLADGAVVFEQVLDLSEQPWLRDHIVGSRVIVPATLFAAIARDAGQQAGISTTAVRRLVLQAPLALDEEHPSALQAIVTRVDDAVLVSIYSRPADAPVQTPWATHAIAELGDASAAEWVAPEAIDAVADGDPQALYRGLASIGLPYGPSFRALTGFRELDGRTAIGSIGAPNSEIPEAMREAIVLDAALQACVLLAGASMDGLLLPMAFDSFACWELGAGPWLARVHLREAVADGALFDLQLSDAAGAAVAQIDGLRLQRIDPKSFARGARDTIHRLVFVDLPAAETTPAPQQIALVVFPPLQPPEQTELASALRDAGVDATLHTPATIGAAPQALVACLFGNAGAAQLCGAAVDVLRARAARPETRLVWFTRGASGLDGSGQVDHAALWGLGRVVNLEHPELELKVVDRAVPAESATEIATCVARTLALPTDETQIAWRGQTALAVRVARGGGKRHPRPFAPSNSGTVLVTGGLTGIGAEVARWLATNGARDLLLWSRRGEGTDGAGALLAELRASGATVSAQAVDVSDGEAVARALSTISAGAPLRAVFHAAGVLDDGVVLEQRTERFARTMAPKLAGALHLNRLIGDRPLEAFVLFSSVVGALGSPGQGAYAAANAAIDALARARRARGHVAHSVAFGPWDTGMGQDLSPAQTARFGRLGFTTLSVAAGLAALEAALASDEPCPLAAPIDFEALVRNLGSEIPSVWRGLLAETAVGKSESRSSAKDDRGEWARDVAGLPEAQREATVLQLVRDQIAAALALQSGAGVAIDKPLQDLGIDSLMAIELRNALGRRVGATLPATLVFDYPTAQAIATFLLTKVRDAAPRTAAAASAAPVSRPAARTDEAIAVVGMACRLPGGIASLDAYWRLLADGRDAISEIPPERWDVDALYDPDPDAAGKMTTRFGGFLQDVDRFDADYFGIAPREARHLDPQQRLLLETTVEALEHAGIPTDRLAGTDTGVFVGLMYNDYESLQGGLSALDGHAVTGTLGSVASGRISYVFGTQGPSMTVDTACSSSLVTLHLAAQALRQRECSLALAGGAALMFSPKTFVEFSRLRGLAPDGRSKSFSAAADGVGWSEGCGMLVLKRLSDAQRDGDPIFGLVRGSAVNQDGRSNGLTAPNGPAQEAVIRQALKNARVRPAEIDYVECHGTGTMLGDPIEARALGAALGEGRSQPVVIGSVKSNLGHTQAAAGVTGVIKTLLCMAHSTIAPSLHFDEPSPHIPWDELPIVVARESRPWPRGDRPRRAGVSSFGISGTNAHVVLEEAPLAAAPRPAPLPVDAAVASARLFVLSAKSPSALRQAAVELSAHVAAHQELTLADLAFSLGVTRTHHAVRRAVVAADRPALLAALAAVAHEDEPQGGGPAARPLAFLFTGQGAQEIGMGAELAREVPSFRQHLERIAASFNGLLPKPLLDVMWAAPGSVDDKLLHETSFTQPALFTLELALAELWRNIGVVPDVVAGHSIGEIGAACFAGVFSVEDAARLVAARGQLMHALPRNGSMIAVDVSEAVAHEVIGSGNSVSIAAINGPTSVVLSGRTEDVRAAVAALVARGARAKELTVSHAFHSALMDPMREAFAEVAATVKWRAATLPVVSSLTGKLAGDEIARADYWVEHVREPVRFHDALVTLHGRGVQSFVEIGPRPVLVGLATEALAAAGPIQGWASLRRGRPERATWLEAVGAVFQTGGAVDFSALLGGTPTRVQLPTYPFQRDRHWVDAGRLVGDLGRGATGNILLGDRLPSATALAVFEQTWSVLSHPWLKELQVHGGTLVDMGVWAEVLRAAAVHALESPTVQLTDIKQAIPLVIAAGAQRIQTTVTRTTQGVHIDVYGQHASAAANGGWTLHVQADAARIEMPHSQETIPAPSAPGVAGEEAWNTLSNSGWSVGGVWRTVREAHVNGARASAELVPAHGPANVPAFLAVPAWLSALGNANADAQRVVGIEKLVVGATLADAHAVTVARTADALAARWIDDDGVVLAHAEGIRFERIDPAMIAGAATVSDAIHAIRWQAAAGGNLRSRSRRIGIVFSAAQQQRANVLAGALERAQHAVERIEASALDRLSNVDVVLALVTEPDPVVAAQLGLRVVQRVTALGTFPQLWWITTQAVAVAERDNADPAAAALWGLGRVVMLEHPELRSRLLDLEPTAAIGDIVTTALNDDTDEDQIAWRGQDRWVPRLELAPRIQVEQRPWRTDGTVIVTGGLGALGVHMASWLVDIGYRDIVLCGRRGRETPGAVDVVRALEARGARVTVATADASDRGALQSVLAQISTEHPLRGVVHAAGVIDDGVLSSQTAEKVARVFGAKVTGALLLDELTQHADLDFFVLLSSMAGTFGSVAQSPYAAANAALDALVARRRARGLPAQSHAWGPWAEGGMAASLRGAQQAQLLRRGFSMIEVDEGLKLLKQAVARPESTLVLGRIQARTLGLRPDGTTAPLWRSLVKSMQGPSTASADLTEAEALTTVDHATDVSGHPLLGARVDLSTDDRVTQGDWQASDALAFLGEHRTEYAALSPPGALLEALWSAAQDGQQARALTQVVLAPPRELPTGQPYVVQSVVREDRVHLAARDGGAGPWMEIARAAIVELDAAPQATNAVATARVRCRERRTPAALIESLRTAGLLFGGAYQGVEEFAVAEGETIGQVRLPESLRPHAHRFALHPCLVDTVLLVAQAALGETGNTVWTPTGAEHIALWRQPQPDEALWVHAKTVGGATPRTVDVSVYDSAQHPVALLRGVSWRRTTAAQLGLHAAPLQLVWREKPLPTQNEEEVLRWLVLVPAGDAGIAAQAAELTRGRSGSVVVQLTGGDVPDADAIAQIREHQALPGGWGLVSLLDAAAPPLFAPELQPDVIERRTHVYRALLEAAHASNAPARVVWLTCGAQRVVDADQNELSSSMLSAAFLSGQASGGGTPVEVIDMEAGCQDLGRLAAELNGRAPRDLFVAWRGKARSVARLTRQAPLRPRASAPNLEGRTLLVVGDARGLGWRAAAWTIARCATRGSIGAVVLAGPGAAAAKAHLDERAGKSTAVFAVEAMDTTTLRDTVRRCGADLPALGGVVWIDAPRHGQTFSSRLASLVGLHQATLEHDLSVFCTVSRASSVIGWPGDAEACTLDALAEAIAIKRGSYGMPATALRLGPVDGLDEEPHAGADERDRHGLGVALLDDARAALVIGLEGAVGLVALGALRAQRISSQAPHLAAFLEELLPTPTVARASRKSASASPALSRDRLMLKMAQTVGRLFGIAPESVNPSKQLREMGMDSLMAVQLRTALSSLVGMPLAAAALLEHPTLDALSQHLLEISSQRTST